MKKAILGLMLATVISLQALAAPSMCATAFQAPMRAADSRDVTERNLTLLLDQVLKKQEAGINSVVGWVQEIERSQSLHPLSVREHTALILVQGLGLLESYGSDEVTSSLKRSLEKSFKHLAGRAPKGREALETLPLTVVRNASEPERALYTAMRERLQKGDKIPFVTKVKNKAHLISEQLTLTQAVSTLMGIAAMIYDPTNIGVVAGALVGLAQAGLIEYTIHLGLGHAGAKTMAVMKRLGPLADFLEEVKVAHQLHHTIVSQDFRAAVLDEKQIALAEKTMLRMLSAMLVDRFKRKYPEKSDADIRASAEFQELLAKRADVVRQGNYGMNASLPAAMKMLVAGTHYYIANFAIWAATGDLGYLIASNAVMTFMTVQSIYAHYYMHYYHEYRTKPNASKLMMAFIDSPLGQLARRRHAEHHYDHFFDAQNGNIMALAPADHLLNDLTEISIEHLIDLQRRGAMPEF